MVTGTYGYYLEGQGEHDVYVRTGQDTFESYAETEKHLNREIELLGIEFASYVIYRFMGTEYSKYARKSYRIEGWQGEAKAFFEYWE